MGTLAAAFQKCLADNKITVFADAAKLVTKQLHIAKNDAEEAKSGLRRKQWKWSTIQAYYSMFHTARALLYAKGFREKHHHCLRVAIAHLYASEGYPFQRMIDQFELAKQLRENADYADDFSENAAKKLVAAAEQWLDTAKKLVKRHK